MRISAGGFSIKADLIDRHQFIYDFLYLLFPLYGSIIMRSIVNVLVGYQAHCFLGLADVGYLNIDRLPVLNRHEQVHLSTGGSSSDLFEHAKFITEDSLA